MTRGCPSRTSLPAPAVNGDGRRLSVDRSAAGDEDDARVDALAFDALAVAQLGVAKGRGTVVLETGVEYRGKKWPSLSAVAREITGTRWSGPRFFGLVGGAGGS